MTTSAGSFTPERGAVAGARSAHVRQTRRRVKEEIAASPWRTSREWCAKLIEDAPEELRGMRVLALLTAVRRLGPVRAKRMLRAADVDPTRTVGELTLRQRRALVAELRGSISV